jgi:FAD/FMN-containing dehydrogenase
MPTPNLPPSPGQPPIIREGPPVISRLSAFELAELRHAKELLETPGLTARLAGTLGRPIEAGLRALPKGASSLVQKVTHVALFQALRLAVASLGTRSPKRSSERFHKVLAGASGGLGGVFGFAALPVELPLSTTIMLRSIADIARSEGHDIGNINSRLSCLEVFALGGKTDADNAVDSSYWAIRAALARSISEAAAWIAEKGVIEQTAPPLLRLIVAIASKFGVVVSEQLAVKAIPLVGAAGGSIVNVLFINHFQDMARGHFIVRRLEARHGLEAVRSAYESLAIRV